MEGIKFREREFELKPGDRLFVYTDGVTEATDCDDKLYGADRLLNALNQNTDVDAKQLLENVKADIDKFVNDSPQFDDITMLGFTYFGV